MINMIPVVGWLLSFIFNVSLAIPFWLVWTVFGVGHTYASWLPPVYQSPDFWPCVGIFMVISILKSVLAPRIVLHHVNTEK